MTDTLDHLAFAPATMLIEPRAAQRMLRCAADRLAGGKGPLPPRETPGPRAGGDDAPCLGAGGDELVAAAAALGLGVPVERDGSARVGSVAVVVIDEAVSYGANVWSWAWWSVTSGEIVRAIDAAAADESVSTVVVALGTPGGDAQAIDDIADAIGRCAKPVVARVDQALSLGQWVAALCGEVSVHPKGMMGSVGVYMPPLVDYSSSEDAPRVLPVAQPEGKATYDWMSPQTEGMAEAVRAEVAALFDQFVDAVATGRGIDPEAVRGMNAKVLMTGQHAVDAGLADTVESTRAFYTRMLSASASSTGRATESKSGRPAGRNNATTTGGRRRASVGRRRGVSNMAASTATTNGAHAMTREEFKEKYPDATDEMLDDAFGTDAEGDEEIEEAETNDVTDPDDKDRDSASARSGGKASGRSNAAASVSDVEALFSGRPGASDHVVRCLREKMTVAEATAFAAGLKASEDATAAADERARAEAIEGVPRGGPRLDTGQRSHAATFSGSAAEADAEVDRLVQERVKATGCTKAAAGRHVMVTRPDLAKALGA